MAIIPSAGPQAVRSVAPNVSAAAAPLQATNQLLQTADALMQDRQNKKAATWWNQRSADLSLELQQFEMDQRKQATASQSEVDYDFIDTHVKQRYSDAVSEARQLGYGLAEPTILQTGAQRRGQIMSSVTSWGAELDVQKRTTGFGDTIGKLQTLARKGFDLNQVKEMLDSTYADAAQVLDPTNPVIKNRQDAYSGVYRSSFEHNIDTATTPAELDTIAASLSGLTDFQEMSAADLDTLLNQVQAKKSSLLAKEKSDGVVLKKLFEDAHKNRVSYYVQGNDTAEVPPVPIEEYVAVLGEEDGYLKFRDQMHARSLSPELQVVKNGTEQDIQAVLAEAERRTANVEDNVSETKKYAALVKAYTSRRQQLSTDPVSYVLKNNDELVALKDQAEQTNDPQAQQEYVAKMVAAQRALNAPKVKLLQPAEVVALSSKFSTQDKGGKEVVAALQQESARWGDNWRYVVDQLRGEKFGAELSVVASMDLATQQGAAEDLMQASKLKAETKKLIGNMDSEAIASAAQNSLQDYRSVTIDSGIPNGAKGFNDMVDSVATLAQYYVTQGVPSKDAVTKARTKILDERYDFVGTGIQTAVPREYNGSYVERGMLAVRQSLSKYTFQVPSSAMLDAVPGPEGDKTRQEEYVRQLEQDAFFIAAKDDQGVYLAVQGGGVVRDSTGTPIYISFTELQGMGALETKKPFNAEIVAPGL